MHFDPRTVAATIVVLGLVFAGIATTVHWSRRTYPGYFRWMCAGLLMIVSLFLLNLRPNAPDWISIVAANSVLVFASILHFEGARRFRGVASRRWLTYGGGIVTSPPLSSIEVIVPGC